MQNLEPKLEHSVNSISTSSGCVESQPLLHHATNIVGLADISDSKYQSTNFQYSVLSSNEIRLIRFSGSPQNFQLKHVFLPNRPDYIALSYVWGDPNLCRTVTCNGKALMITDNLYKLLATVFAAIRRNGADSLWRKGEEVYLWADGICINQKDVLEKNAQVSMMSDIYRKARGSIGYIGAPSLGVDPAAIFDLFSHFAGSNIKTAEGVKVFNKNEYPEAAMGGFWDSAWFFRTWIAQEVILSKEMMCMYGDESKAITFSFEVLGALIKQIATPGMPNLKLLGRLDNRIRAGMAFEMVYFWCYIRANLVVDPGGTKLFEILTRLQRAEATDKRDKVYSVLGMVKDSDRQAIKVNYAPSNSVQDTYSDVAKYCLLTPDCMSILLHAGTRRDIKNMPTWVPDWSSQHCNPLNYQLYHAAGNTTSTASISNCGQKINTKALLFDKIASCGFEMAYPRFEFENRSILPGESTPWAVMVMLKEICERYIGSVQKQLGRSPGRNPDEPLNQIVYSLLTADRSYGYARAASNDVKYYDVFAEIYTRDSDDPFPNVDDVIERYRPLEVMTIQCQGGRKICLTQAGMLGLVPNDAKIGDWIALMPGANVPYILRNKQDHEFELIGHAYIHGAMDGEVLTRYRTMGQDNNQIFRQKISLV